MGKKKKKTQKHNKITCNLGNTLIRAVSEASPRQIRSMTAENVRGGGEGGMEKKILSITQRKYQNYIDGSLTSVNGLDVEDSSVTEGGAALKREEAGSVGLEVAGRVVGGNGVAGLVVVPNMGWEE